MRLHSQDGRSATIFFQLLVIGLLGLSGVAHANELIAKTETVTNFGLMTPSFWRSQSLSRSPSNVVAFSDSFIRSELIKNNLGMMLERREIASFSGTSNVLVAAAKNNSAASLADATYSLRGKLNSFDFDALGVVIQSTSKDKYFFWKITPKIIQIRSYKTGFGNGQLRVDGSNQSLNGNIYQQAMNPFGFLVVNTPLELGLGVALDARLDWRIKEGLLSIEAINLLSEVKANGAHYSNRNYQLNTTSGSIVLSGLPSISGTYGQTNQRLVLPKILKVGYSKISEHPTSNWGWGAGFVGVDRDAFAWIAASYNRGNHTLEAKTFALRNLLLTYRGENIFSTGLGMDVSLACGLQGTLQSAVTAIRYVF